MLKRFTGERERQLEIGLRLYQRRWIAAGAKPAGWSRRPAGSSNHSASSSPPAHLQKTTRRPNEQDVAKILNENGFDAIQGAGGFLNQLVDGHIEFLDRTSIYAPPAPGKENDPLRWNLSMRMLQLPNMPGFEPQSWVPRMSASYATLQLEIDKAFDNVGPLFDAIQDHEDAWANTLEGWKTDPYGPQVDVRKEFIANLGQRITLVTDYDTPIAVKSERSCSPIEAKNEKALAETLEKWMTKEPDVERREVGQYVIWERVPEAVALENPADRRAAARLHGGANRARQSIEGRGRAARARAAQLGRYAWRWAT